MEVFPKQPFFWPDRSQLYPCMGTWPSLCTSSLVRNQWHPMESHPCEHNPLKLLKIKKYHWWIKSYASWIIVKSKKRWSADCGVNVIWLWVSVGWRGCQQENLGHLQHFCFPLNSVAIRYFSLAPSEALYVIMHHCNPRQATSKIFTQSCKTAKLAETDFHSAIATAVGVNHNKIIKAIQ